MLVYNIGKVVTPLAKDRDDFSRPLFEQADAAVLIENGLIVEVNSSRHLQTSVSTDVPRYDAQGKLMLPGFIDCHTHPVFVGNRANEFFLRNRGASYQEIAASGGGINTSAQKIAAATVEQIVRESLPRFESSLACGVTTIECKSGYGLTWKGEEKLLLSLREIKKIVPQKMTMTFLAHVVPREWQERRNEYVQSIIDEMIPEAAQRKLAECVDVFCEEGAFTKDESRKILQAAKDEGMSVTIHANQFGHSGGAMLAAELGARSADHLEHLDDEEIAAMRDKGVAAVALPACVFFLNSIPYPPMRKIVDSGLRLALATDMNPGTSMTESIPLCMTIAPIYGKLSANELLWAVTFDPARILGVEGMVGSIEAGKAADFCLWNTPNAESISYAFGNTFADEVWIDGKPALVNESVIARY